MAEPEGEELCAMGVLEAGMSVAAAVEGGVAVVHFDLADPPGTFRVRRGKDVEEAYTTDAEVVKVKGDRPPWEWGELPDTGIEVRLLSAPGWPGGPGVEKGPLRVGVRPAG